MIKRIFRGVAAVLICVLALGALTSAIQLIGGGISWSDKTDEPEKLYPTGAEHLNVIASNRIAHLSYESGTPEFVIDKEGQVTLPYTGLIFGNSQTVTLDNSPDFRVLQRERLLHGAQPGNNSALP